MKNKKRKIRLKKLWGKLPHEEYLPAGYLEEKGYPKLAKLLKINV